MKNRDFIKYDEPYPTIGELIKDKDYDYVSYRIDYPGCDEEHGMFVGCFAAVDGRIVPLDGDSYSLEEKVIESQEWNDPVEGIENGFLVVVIWDVIRG